MMKKVTYLMTLILMTVALMSTSCCKDDPIVPDGPLTENDLQGVWVSDSYTALNGDMYDDCATVPENEQLLITLDIDGDADVGDYCDPMASILPYYVSLDNDVEVSDIIYDKVFELSRNGKSLKFEVVSYVRDPETLTLQLRYTNDDNFPKGRYVLIK